MATLRIGILTGGGDAPGLNAVIRAVVYTATRAYGWEVWGIRDGYEGFLKPNGAFPLTPERVHGILPLGGTILGAANRGNPFARKVIRDGRETYEDASGDIVRRVDELGLEALLVVGGDGTLGAARDLAQLGLPIIGIPKTIDNDVGGTEATIGFDTAVNTAVEALDRLHFTAEAHHRAMVVELMGRHAGFIALKAGLAGGADVILIPEIPFDFEAICAKVKRRAAAGRPFSILAVAEGAYPREGQPVYYIPGDGVYSPRLGGIGAQVAHFLNEHCAESRTLVLGHLQRGGTPSAFDRWLATRFGHEAVRLAARRAWGHMVALRGREIHAIPLDEALHTPKRVDPHSAEVQTARDIGIVFGDETPGPDTSQGAAPPSGSGTGPHP